MITSPTAFLSLQEVKDAIFRDLRAAIRPGTALRDLADNAVHDGCEHDRQRGLIGADWLGPLTRYGFGPGQRGGPQDVANNMTENNIIDFQSVADKRRTPIEIAQQSDEDRRHQYIIELEHDILGLQQQVCALHRDLERDRARRRMG
jgi:hypothetical protein